MSHDAAASLARLLDAPRAASRARRLLARAGGPHRLRLADEPWLRREGELSAVEARRLRAAMALGLAALAGPPPRALTRPEDLAALAAPLALLPVEELWAVPVDAGLRPLGRHVAARGGRASCSVDGADILREALLARAGGLFLAHNHPSGDPTPSEQDRRFTRLLSAQAASLGLELHDHLVVAGDAWASCTSARRGRLGDAAGDPAGPPLSGGPGGGW